MSYGLMLSKLIVVLLGFFIIMLPSLIYHLVVFGRTFTYRSLVDSTTTSLFVTFSLLIISSIIGTFYSFPLFILILAILYYKGKTGFFKFDGNIGKSNQFEILLVLVSTVAVYILLISPQLNDFHVLSNYIYSFDGHELYHFSYGFSDGDDTIYAYIPWGEILTSLHYLPGYSLQSPFYSISYISGGYVLIGYLFGLFGDFGIYAIAGIPLYFIFVTQLILVSWLNEYKLNNYYWIVIGLLFATPRFFVLQTEIIREVYFIPFILLTFYNFFLYHKYKSNNYLYLSLFSLVLIASIRDTALILVFTILMSYIVVFGHSFLRKTFSEIGIYKLIIIFLPVIGWYVRNIYYYSNPAYILFQNIFGNDLVLSSQYHEAANFISYILSTGYRNNINFLYPSLFLGIVYLLVTSYRERFNRFVVFSVFLYIAIFFSLTPIYNSPRYYLYLFNALLALFSTLAAIKIFKYLKIQKYFESAHTKYIMHILIIFLAIGIIGYGISHSNPTYESKCYFMDMWTLDESISDETILILNSDLIYKNDRYVDLPALTKTRSISLPNFAYHLYRSNITDYNGISQELQKNNMSHIIFVHYMNESFKEELLRNTTTKNSRAFVDISKFNKEPTYNYILDKSIVERNIQLRDNKIATIYNIKR